MGVGYHMITDPLIIPFYGMFATYFLLQPTEHAQYSETSNLLKIAPVIYLVIYVGFFKRPASTRSSTKESEAGSSASAEHNSANSQPETLLKQADGSKDSSDSKQFNSYRNFFSVGLVCSCVGDIYVSSQTTFIYGVLAFGAAHIMYTFGLRARGRIAKVKYSWYCYLFAVLIMVMLITSKLDSYFVMSLVCIYDFVVFTTMFHALRNYETHEDMPAFCGVIGAVTFAVSDFLIAIDLWVMPLPYPQILIMVTYYLAQFFLALSVI